MVWSLAACPLAAQTAGVGGPGASYPAEQTAAGKGGPVLFCPTRQPAANDAFGRSAVSRTAVGEDAPVSPYPTAQRSAGDAPGAFYAAQVSAVGRTGGSPSAVGGTDRSPSAMGMRPDQRQAAPPAASEIPFERPLAAVLADVGGHFGVEIRCKRFLADTVRVPYADFRVRPYSLEETLDNLLRPLDLKWSGDERITVEPYEYYRRTVADGEKLLAWLSAQYDDRAGWEVRRKRIVAGVREALALGPFQRGMAPQPQYILGPELPHDGYSTQNYALETLPGLYVCGTIYAPAQPPLPGWNMLPGHRREVLRERPRKGPRKGPRERGDRLPGERSRGDRLPVELRPLIVAPSGHWPGGRYREEHQRLMATLARMGAVAVDTDIFGWGESERQVGREAHTAPYAMQMQVVWSQAVTDRIIASRRDIDTARMAATGGSGGATHALLLAAVDGRFAALAPVVHLVSHFDGGCPCESGRPVTLAAGGSCMPEILAAVCAPKPVLTVSDGGDWTASYPALEYPFLRRIWGFYGAEDAVRNVHFPDGKHDFGPDKRRAVYDFFALTLGLDASRADESRTELLPAEALQSFGGEWPAGAVRSREELERMIEKLQ